MVALSLLSYSAFSSADIISVVMNAPRKMLGARASGEGGGGGRRVRSINMRRGHYLMQYVYNNANATNGRESLRRD